MQKRLRPLSKSGLKKVTRKSSQTFKNDNELNLQTTPDIRLSLSIKHKRNVNWNNFEVCKIFGELKEKKLNLNNADAYFSHLPPLVKRNMPVNSYWNNLLTQNLGGQMTPNPLLKRSYNFFSSQLETQKWRQHKESLKGENSLRGTPREVSLDEISETLEGTPNRYLNLRKSLQGEKQADQP